MARSKELIETGKEVVEALRSEYKVGTGNATASISWLSPQLFVIKKGYKHFTVTVRELSNGN